MPTQKRLSLPRQAVAQRMDSHRHWLSGLQPGAAVVAETVGAVFARFRSFLCVGGQQNPQPPNQHFLRMIQRNASSELN